jgi:tRNA A37 threonylcarbamoyltransferase TsaD
VLVPALSLSTDNAAMIAAAGLRRLELAGASPLDFNADPSLQMTDIAPVPSSNQ